MTTAPPTWCPRCLALTEGARVCGRCGLDQEGEAVGRLRLVVHRLSEIDAEAATLGRERSTLLSERERLLAAIGERHGDEIAALYRHEAPRTSEWRADVVRDVLLWVGGALLAIAALTFAAFAWQRLDDAGRAAMLVGATVLAGFAAFGLRERLTATAEVFAALTLTLLLIDWLALRRAGAGSGLDLPTWWALGTFVAGTAALGAGRVFASARLLTVLAGATSAYLAVFAAAETAPSISMGFSVSAAALVAATVGLRRIEWRTAARLASIATFVFSASAVVSVLVGIADSGDPTLALVIASALVGVAPAAAAAVTGDRVFRDVLVAAATLAVLGAASIGWWSATDDAWLAALVAATTLAVSAGGSFAPEAARRGIVGAGSSLLATVTLACAGVIGAGVLGPLGTVEDAWSHEPSTGIVRALPVSAPIEEAGPIAVVLLCAAAGAVLLLLHARGDQATMVGATVAAGSASAAAVALLPLAFDTRVDVAVALTASPALVALAMTGVADRRRWRPWMAAFVAGASTLAPAAVGWSLASEATTIALCAAALVASAAGAVAARGQSSTRLAMVGLTGVAFVALAAMAARTADATATQVGIVTTGAAAVVLIAASLWREDDGWPAEVVAAVAMGVGLGLAFDDELDLAIALTLLSPALAVAGTRADRRWYVAAASAVAVFATWAWLLVADVRTLEAYTLPAAVGALAAGEVRRRLAPRSSSWLVYAPALLIAFAPTLALAVVDDGVVRPIALGVAATSVIAAGARWRMQAPLVIGTGTLGVLALDTLGPVAADLPRWLTIAIVGAVVLWLGATADRRLTQLRRARERFSAMER